MYRLVTSNWLSGTVFPPRLQWLDLLVPYFRVKQEQERNFHRNDICPLFKTADLPNLHGMLGGARIFESQSVLRVCAHLLTRGGGAKIVFSLATISDRWPQSTRSAICTLRFFSALAEIFAKKIFKFNIFVTKGRGSQLHPSSPLCTKLDHTAPGSRRPFQTLFVNSASARILDNKWCGQCP